MIRRLLIVIIVAVSWSARADDRFDTLFLAWFGDPTTTMAVQWIAPGELDEIETVPLSCVPADAADAKPTTAMSVAAAFGSGDLLRHRVTFTGLTPDTRYRLILPGSDKKPFFRTAPTKLDKPMVFAEGGDLGTYDETEMLHRHAAKWDPLFAVLGGDLAYADGKKPKTWQKFLRQWRANMITADGRLIPMIVTIGNHEVQGGFGRGRQHGPLYYALFDGLFPDTGYAALDVGEDVSFLLLDTNHSTRIPGKQTEWLADALEQRKQRRFMIPIYHVPMYPVYRPVKGGARGDARGKMREHWLPLFDRYELPLAFEHDDHVYKRTHKLRGGQRDENGTLYLGDGAWGKLRSEEVSARSRPYAAVAMTKRHVMRVTLHPEGAEQAFDVLVVDEHGQELDRYPPSP